MTSCSVAVLPTTRLPLLKSLMVSLPEPTLNTNLSSLGPPQSRSLPAPPFSVSVPPVIEPREAGVRLVAIARCISLGTALSAGEQGIGFFDDGLCEFGFRSNTHDTLSWLFSRFDGLHGRSALGQLLTVEDALLAVLHDFSEFIDVAIAISTRRLRAEPQAGILVDSVEADRDADLTQQRSSFPPGVELLLHRTHASG